MLVRQVVRAIVVGWWALDFQAIALAQVTEHQVVDLSLTVSPELPCVWPLGMTPHAVIPTRTFGPGPYHRDLIVIDEHTGTQWDAPAHFVPPPDSGLPGAGPMGSMTGEKVPAWQFCGEACVVDVTAHCDDAPAGSSYLIRPNSLQAWEQSHRPFRAGDVVLLRSGYSDRYYLPFPEGDRFVAQALRGDKPGWAAPTPESMIYLGEKGVTTLGVDGASMGPLPDLAAATHQAGGQRGMIWTECATNLGALPTTGAFFAILGPKHAGGSGGECRCVAITEPKLAARLIESAKQKRVADLSVTLNEEYPVTWPGYGAGDEASRYIGKALNRFQKSRGPYFAMTHLFDGQAGTHVVLPSYSLPPDGFSPDRYDEPTRELLDRYEATHGRRGTSNMSLADAPLSAMMGEAHVIDVRGLMGNTQSDQWPRSPQITAEFLRQHEADHRPIRPGEVVLFYSGYSDAHFQPLPEAPTVDRLFAAALAGKAEGWPALTPEAVDYLSERGVRCVGTDGPTLGGVDRDQALMTYWHVAGRGMLPIEFLTNLGEIAERPAFFLFAPVKIKGTRGGYGRAIALY